MLDRRLVFNVANVEMLPIPIPIPNSRFPTLACGAETRRFRSHEGTEAAFELARYARSPVSNQTIKQSKQSNNPNSPNSGNFKLKMR